MSGDTNPDEAILAALEARVLRAVELIGQLREENRRLAEVARAAAAVAGPPEGDGAASTAGLTARIDELERERQRLLADRRALTRRVEEILARLEYLESESVPH